MDQVMIFDLRGPYGHYRKNYSPASPVTFPCPTPTAAIGTIAGIVGMEKRDYLKEFAKGSWKLGIRLLAPVQKYRAAINLINTKLDPKTFRPKGKSPRIQIPFEFLKDASFRFYFWHEEVELFASVKNQLETGTTIYTPSLGLAQCIGEVDFQGVAAAKPIKKNGAVSFSSVVPLAKEVEIDYEEGKRYQRVTFPVVMHEERVVRKYQDAIVEEAAEDVCARNVTAFEVDGTNIAFFESDL